MEIIVILRKNIYLIILILLISGCTKTNLVNTSVLSPNEEIETYYGYLIIPKINMKLGFFNVDNKLNDVSKNIELIETGISNTYLIAAHSGSGKIAYFNDLRYLKIGDEMYLKFKDKTNYYIIANIRNEIKDGTISIENKEDYLILTTCDQINKGYQLIIEGKLV